MSVELFILLVVSYVVLLSLILGARLKGAVQEMDQSDYENQTKLLLAVKKGISTCL